MDLTTKARIRSKLAAQGMYWTDAEIEEYARKNFGGPQEPAVAKQIVDKEIPFPERAAPEEEGLVANVYDALGAGLWSALDVATVGLAGWAMPGVEKHMEEEFMQTLGGRVGGTLGGLAGFMVPMGWAKAATTTVARTAKGLIQGGDKAIKAGKVIANPTTRQAQSMAAKKIMEASEKEVLKSGGKALTWSEAKRMAVETSDDVIGFANKSIPGKILKGKGPAYQMEHSTEFVNMARQTMRSAMPERLAASLSKSGVTMGEKQLLGLSDEVVELLATKPYNSIESIFAGKYSTPIWSGVRNLIGGMGQEAINFGIVGTVMDAVQYQKGTLDTSDSSFGSRILNHVLIGGAFGGVRFIPGGSQSGMMKNIVRASGRESAKINKAIGKMGLDEAKALGRITLKNDKSAIFEIDGIKLTAENLRKGTRSVTKTQLPQLKNAMIKHNKQLLSDFRKRFYPSVKGEAAGVGDMAKDLWGSIPRMAVGAVIFNHASLADGAFDHMGRGEMAFHLGLGALMTKGGRPLHRGGEVKKGFHFGERPYYYNSDLKDIYTSMNQMNISSHHIGDIVKQFDGNLFTDWAAKNPIADVENIIQTLMDKNVVYDASHAKIGLDNRKETALLNRELMDILSPIFGTMKSRYIEFNPNVTKEEINLALKEVKNLKSEVLSTEESPVYLNSRNIIAKSIVESSQEAWSEINGRIYDNFTQQMGVLTENIDYVAKDGKMDDYWYDTTGLGTADRMTIRKLDKLKSRLKNMDIIKIADFTIGKGKGHTVKLDSEKLKKIRTIQDDFEFGLGKEFYGETFTEPIDMLDPTMWSQFHQIDYHKNVARVHDVILGKQVSGIEKADSDGMQSLIGEVLSHKDNVDRNIITEKPGNVKIIPPEGTFDQQELHALRGFVNDLWSINAASGREAVDSRTFDVPMDKIRQLKDELVRAGMPDPVTHQFDSRMENWVDRAVNYGIEEATRGLDISPNKGLAVKRLLLNGFITLSTDSQGRGVALKAPLDLTYEQIKRIKPLATDAEVETIKAAYKRIKENTGDVLTFQEDYNMKGLTEDQLGSVLTADHILNMKRLGGDIENYSEAIDIRIVGISNEIKALESEIANAITTPAAEIRAALNQKQEVLNEVNRFQMSFAKSMGGSVEVSRASAHLELTKGYRGDDNMTLMDHIDKLSSDAPGEFIKRTKQIRDLQIAIANKVSERPDIATQFSERRQEAVLRLKHEEIEGHMHDNQTRITPDLFLEKHSIKIEDVFNPGEAGHGITYDSASDAIYALYKEKVIIGKNIDSFIDRMFSFANEKRESAGDELRNNIAHIAGLYDRRFNIKRLTVDVSSGQGKFENSEISKGFLTDIYSEIFAEGQSNDMILLSSDYMENNRVKSIATNTEGLTSISKALSGDFGASLSEGAVANLKYFKEGKVSSPEAGREYYEGIDLAEQLVRGKHYVVGVDENINLVIPESGFNSMATKFVEWYERVRKDPYVNSARKKTNRVGKAADNLFKNSLEVYFDRLKTIKNNDGTYDVNKFKAGSAINEAQYMEDAMFTIFNVMYGERIDGDWLQDAYFSSENARKSYKYKRLAQNQGYSRNSAEKRQILKSIYAESSNERYRDIVDTYSGKENFHTLVINDADKSITGEVVNRLITDNRSIAEANLKLQYDNGEIKKADYNNMLSDLKKHNSINAEAVNAMTGVRRDALDYLLLLNGQGNLIGESAGQKPVGLTSFKDESGIIHTFVNKTHYFYDSRLDNFFANNPNIDMVAFKSGAKKTKKIDSNDAKLKNQFIPHEPPSIDSGMNMVEFINGIKADSKHQSVMPVRIDQTLSGAIYGRAGDAKILKQFDNWSSKKVQADLYEYSRADLAKEFAELNINLYNPEDTGLASREARSYLRSSVNKDGISTEAPNASVASIWMEADGVPFSNISKNLYDALIKRKYIDDAGVFDGYTDAGGAPILRGNLAGDLNIPVYSNGKQIKLGEAHIGADYLDRKIHFRGSFGPVVVRKFGTKERPAYREKATLTVAFKHDGRDVIVDLKHRTIEDPLNKGAKLNAKEYKKISSMVESLNKKLKNSELEYYRDVFNELKDDAYDGAQLAIMALPAPRTGPHDAMVVKVRNMLPKGDGGIMELNSYDVTMRGQRDYDTDKLYFYMDTPFSAMSESYRVNGDILEPLPITNKFIPELDMYSNQSYKAYNQNIKDYSRKRGTVVKMHRKLTYAKRLFDEIGSIKIGNAEIISSKDTKAAKQKLVDASQGVLDIYDGTPNSLKNLNDWTNDILFGDEPFFKMQYTKEGKITQGTVPDEAYRLIVKKVLDDFGRLLNVEGEIYEAGEAKKPRYQDMVSTYSDFRSEYGRKVINWNFYNYLVKKGHEPAANNIFFGMDAPRKDAKMVGDIMGALSDQVYKNPTPFLKSMKAVADRDFLRVRETYSPQGDFFNAGLDNLMGRFKANLLETFRRTGDIRDVEGLGEADPIKDMWDAFHKQGKHEEMMVQANTIEEQIRRSEWRLAELEKDPNADPVSIEMQKEDLIIKSQALNAVLDRMIVKPDANGKPIFGQKLQHYRKDKDNEVKAFNRDISIRDAKTGKLIKKLFPGQDHLLKSDEVAVRNPVVLKAVVEHDLIDGLAFANSTLGYYAHVHDSDLPDFRKIVNRTKGKIKKSMIDIMDEKGYRDWSEHQVRSLKAIESGLEEIQRLAVKNAIVSEGMQQPQSDTFIGKLPTSRESYGLDFLMSLLTPDYSGNPNEYHFSPKTGSFLVAVGAPKRSVINAVFQAMETYQVHTDHKAFVQNFARTHRGFYDAIVAGRGFNEGIQRLAESNFEGALLKTTLDKAMHNPYMTRADFKTIAETFEMTPAIKSDYAEMFRQIVQEGALTDPKTAFNIKKQIIEDPNLGPEVYNSIFQLSRGEVVFDGLSSQQFGIHHRAEGQLVGEMLMTRSDIFNRNLIGKKPSGKSVNIKDELIKVVGRQNEVDGKCP